MQRTLAKVYAADPSGELATGEGDRCGGKIKRARFLQRSRLPGGGGIDRPGTVIPKAGAKL